MKILETVLQIIIPLLVLGVIIMAHELGHFSVAKLFKIKVLEFWIFMGPKLFKWKRNETEYSLRAIPIGGMVRMEGEESTSEDSGSFTNKHPAKRMAVIAAGPITNIIFALLIVIIVTVFSGYVINSIKLDGTDSSAYAAGIREGDKILSVNGVNVFDPSVDFQLLTYLKTDKPITMQVQRAGAPGPIDVSIIPTKSYKLGVGFSKDTTTPTSIVSVDPQGPAQKAGIQVGDILKAINGNPVADFKKAKELISGSGGAQLNIVVSRNGVDVPIKITPTLQDDNIGIKLDSGKGNPIEVLGASVNYCISVTRSNFYTIGWLITGKLSLDNISGPVGMVKAMGDVMHSSPTFPDNLVNLMLTAAFISLCLGVFNLLPFPALDGSKILILLFEIITKKKLKPEKEAIISIVGLAILLSFMLAVTVMDIMKFF